MADVAARNHADFDCDYVVIGSGFGGSVSALRLSEKGYSVIVLEKGRRLGAADFPKTNWNLKKWMWWPKMGWRGPFKMTFLRHVTVLSGVGVGGGSLVYANTLPVPKRPFFTSLSWAHLADWEAELKPHYEMALHMLGAAPNPNFYEGDLALKSIAEEMGRGDHFHTVNTSVYYGEPGVTVPDPYFDGKGPDRTGCIHCARCMIGCKDNAKNTLDKNYLYLAEGLGCEVRADSQVFDVRPLSGGGYEIDYRQTAEGADRRVRARGVIISGGVMGTLPLLLKLKASSLPKLSDRLGETIRTNSESIIHVTSLDKTKDLAQGVAITSIVHIDDDSHIEIVRGPKGSGFWRFLSGLHTSGSNGMVRLINAGLGMMRHPIRFIRALTVRDFAKSSQILLFMQTLDSTLRFGRGRFGGLTSSVSTGEAPKASIPMATEIANRFAEKVDGVPLSLFTETLLNIPTTAHILGGCCMGKDASEGVIDKDNRVFGYENMYVADGSMISANPGVNPSLSITALAERAMSKIPAKGAERAMDSELLMTSEIN
jgi:cholesterol oxidase